MAEKILVPALVQEVLFNPHEDEFPEELEYMNKNYPEFNGWKGELDRDSAKFDHEKAASYDYKAKLFAPDGSEYEGEVGYRNINGWDFNDTTFYLCVKTIQEPIQILEPVTLYYNGRDGGDGSGRLYWYLDEYSSYEWEEKGEGFDCSGRITSFVGSPEYLEAVENEKRVRSESLD